MTDKIGTKSEKNKLQQEFIDGFGIPPRIADELVKTAHEYIEAIKDGPPEGKIFFTAVAKEEPVDKPLEKCKTVRVVLTLFTEEDREIRKKKGYPAERRHKIAQMCQEAVEQGALLTEEDLADLLVKSTQTIRADIAYLKRDGITVPIRDSL